MAEIEGSPSTTESLRAAWILPLPGKLHQLYSRRSKRIVFGSVAVVVLLLFNTYFARKHGSAIYNHLRGQTQLIGFSSVSHRTDFEETVKLLWEPSKLPITAQNFTDQDGTVWEMPREPIWTHSLGKRLLILDSDNRPFNEIGEITYPHRQSWKDISHLSAGMLSHYMYSIIHGYDYRLYRSPQHPDRGASWAKVVMTIEALRAGYEYVLFIDSDAQMTNPGIPLEWLFNRWNLTSSEVFSIAQAPDLDRDKDKFGKRGANTGFYLVKNEPSALAILQAWAECPERYPGCEEWKVGPSMDQPAFCDYVRYDPAFRSLIKVLPCNEVNGYPDRFGETKCSGVFVRHVWMDKPQTKDWFAHAVLQAFVPQLHLDFVSRMDELVVDWRDKTLRGAEMLG